MVKIMMGTIIKTDGNKGEPNGCSVHNLVCRRIIVSSLAIYISRDICNDNRENSIITIEYRYCGSISNTSICVCKDETDS
jgi:hypothetical protein